MKDAPPFDARELRALSRKYGAPERAELRMSQWPMPRASRGDRRGEVVFAILNRRDQILVHTKSFYPKGIYRLPSGGIRWDEEVEEALFREVEEETGLPVSVDRFVGLIVYAVRSRPRPFASYVFLLRTDKLHARVQDASEGITGFKELTLPELRAATQRLHDLSAGLRAWGKFRAFAHELVADALAARKK